MVTVKNANIITLYRLIKICTCRRNYNLLFCYF